MTGWGDRCWRVDPVSLSEAAHPTGGYRFAESAALVFHCASRKRIEDVKSN